ncbi:MAG: hypothetical protein L0H59_04320 [Tomitella sp.]|nr:hypothetical protein [Tomitella sp.]
MSTVGVWLVCTAALAAAAGITARIAATRMRWRRGDTMPSAERRSPVNSQAGAVDEVWGQAMPAAVIGGAPRELTAGLYGAVVGPELPAAAAALHDDDPPELTAALVFGQLTVPAPQGWMLVSQVPAVTGEDSSGLRTSVDTAALIAERDRTTIAELQAAGKAVTDRAIVRGALTLRPGSDAGQTMPFVPPYLDEVLTVAQNYPH